MFNEKIKLSEEIVREIIDENYDLGEILSITPLESGHESDNVKFSTKKGDFVLKLYVYPNLDQFQDRMNEYELLHEYGVKVPIPIKNKKKVFVTSYDEKNLLVVLTFISGEPIYREDEPLMYSWMKWFGKQFGIFHNKSKQIPFELYKQKMKNGESYELPLPPGDWILQLYNEREFLLPEHDKNKEIIEAFEQFLVDVEESDLSQLTTGIAHGDMMPGNFLKKNEELKGILDFGGGYYSLMADIGRWLMYTKLYKPEVKNYFKDFILPYLEHSEIPVKELKSLTLFLRSTAYLQYFYYAYRIHNNITQGLEEDELEDSEVYNWRGFNDGIKFVEIFSKIDNNYFYDLATQV